LFLALLSVIAIGLMSAASAHQLHTASTTVLFNERTGNIEVIHRFFLHDAEHAVKQLFDKKADIHQLKRTQAQFSAYVFERFGLQTLEGKTLELSEVGYDVAWRIVDARHWVPQHRERIYIFAFRRPDCPGLGNSVQKWKIDIFAFQRALDCLSPFGRPITLDNVIEERVPEKYTLSTGTWEALLRHKEKHRAKGNGFGFGIIQPPYHGKITRTLSARYYKDGAEILISREEPRPRRLTPLECSRLMGFPKKYQRFFQRENIDYPQPVSDFQAYRQLGNSVAVPVIRDLARFMVTEMIKNGVFEKQPVKQAVE